MILEIEKLTASYGDSQVLFGIDLQVDTDETVCILGRNGVGKTTLIKTIMGLVHSTSGSIKYNNRNIVGLKPHKVSNLGVAYVPQGKRIFYNLSVKENLQIAERKDKKNPNQWTIEKIYKLFPILKTREGLRGTSLSGGEQQMLTIARGLMQNPKLLLLDEITEGLAPIIVNELEEIGQELRKSNVSILLAEQNIKFAMAISSRCYILEKGKVVFSGNNSEVSQETIIKYLSA